MATDGHGERKSQKCTSERVEASDLIGRELGGIGEELLEANSLIVPAIVEELVKQLECRQQVVLLQQEVHHAIAQRRPLHVHQAPIQKPPQSQFLTAKAIDKQQEEQEPLSVLDLSLSLSPCMNYGKQWSHRRIEGGV